MHRVSCAHLLTERLPLAFVHLRQLLYEAERKLERHRTPGLPAHMGSKAAFRLALDQLWLAVQHGRECARILGGYSACKLDSRVGTEGLLKLWFELAEILMRQHHADIVLAGLSQDQSDVPAKIVLRHVDVDDGGGMDGEWKSSGIGIEERRPASPFVSGPAGMLDDPESPVLWRATGTASAAVDPDPAVHDRIMDVLF